jgi:hypothetical protein
MQDHPALVKGILETVDFLPYSPDLNPLDFSIWRILQAEVQAKPHIIWTPYACSLRQKGTGQQWNTYKGSTAASRPSWQKMPPSLNRWMANSLTHTRSLWGHHKFQQDINACTWKKCTLFHNLSPLPCTNRYLLLKWQCHEIFYR